MALLGCQGEMQEGLSPAEPAVTDSAVVVSAEAHPAPMASAVTILGLTLSPASATLAPGGQVRFDPQGWLANSNTPIVASVTWTATGGTISSSGVYTAGSTPGTYEVMARSTTTGHYEPAAITISGSAPAVTVQRITLTPASATVTKGGNQQFAVSALLSTGASESNTAVTYIATGGTISSAGLFKAGNQAGNYWVIARSSNGKADTSTVVVSATTPVISGITVTPGTATVAPAATQQFAASAVMSDGSAVSKPAVTWSATGGTISSAGLYSAGTTPGTYRVIAASSNGRADTSAISVTSPTPTITGITMSPASVTLSVGASQTFTVLASLSNGSSQSNPAVTWAATGGTVSSGRYTAGSAAGSYRVIATASNGRADTSSVTIAGSAPPPPATGSKNPNEPAGYSKITDQPFNSLTADGWRVDGGSPTLLTDATAPVSPSGIARAPMPAGMRAGGGIWTLERSLPGTNKVYMSMTFKLSSNYQGEPSGTNKLGFVWVHDNPSIFLSTEGGGSGNLIATVRLQNVPDARGNGNGLPPNLGKSGVVSRGVWHTWEVELISNSNGAANGVARWWLDGVLIGEHTNVQYASSGQSRTFNLASVAPIWGGMGGTVSSTQSIDYDNVYLSGSN